MDNLYQDLPWELIADALTGELTPETEKNWQQWLSDPENERIFLLIQDQWKNGMKDYRYYKMADEHAAWRTLQSHIKTKSYAGQPGLMRSLVMRHILAAAAISVGLIAIVWFATVSNKPQVYQTADIQQKIELSDGTSVTMHPQTRIEVSRAFGKSDRSIRMDFGEAEFDVAHHTGNPFSVEMGSTLVKDIGTRFIIRKEERSIHLAVSEGKVAFIRTVDGENREIDAGSAISYDTGTREFGPREPVSSSKAIESLLSFEGTPLLEVLNALHTVYGKQVVPKGNAGQMKLTAKLYGMPYDTALAVICSSLSLEHQTMNGITVLKSLEREQP